MNRTSDCLRLLIAFLGLVFCVTSLPGQTTNTYRITPESVTILIGESSPFRMVDQNGRAQHGVTWDISDSYALETSGADEVVVTAKRAGDFHLTARVDHSTAEATINVVEGTSLPIGAMKWSAGKAPGCTTIKMVPAVPSANGPDLFEQSECEDGSYIAAYTSDGVQMWRRKMGAGQPAKIGLTKIDSAKIDKGNQPVVPIRLDSRASSVCDSIMVGAEQEKVREVLNQHHVSFREDAAGEQIWMVEESNAQCKLWFDEKWRVAKKRKTIVSE
jgi:hypothetical protein